MGLRNTLKILSSNFSLTWKSGLYKLVSFFAIIFLCYILVSPIFTELKSADLMGKFTALFESLFAFKGAEITKTATDIATELNSVMMDSYIVNIIVMFVLLFAVLPFLFDLSNVAECDVLYGAMSCNTRLNYVASFMGCLRASFKVALLRLAITIPYSLIVLFVLYAIINMILIGGFATYLALFLLLFVCVVAIAFERALLGYFAPATIIQDMKAKCLIKRGFCLNLKQFSRNFASNFILSICVFFVNAFIGIYTFGVGLVITLPSSLLCYNILSMVSYCNAFGINYYVSPSEIVYSKKLDEQLSLKDMQYLI